MGDNMHASNIINNSLRIINDGIEQIRANLWNVFLFIVALTS
jgi:hypothetical protein